MLSSLAAALVAATPDAILIVDAAGHYVEAKPVALALLGYSREVLLRLSVAAGPPGPTWAAEEYTHLLGVGNWQGEVAVRTHDGWCRRRPAPSGFPPLMDPTTSRFCAT